ncbi:glycosyltransferase family 2 protein [Rathayibacter sp. VKM Ac-2801]|uniref:glycosyltransferase family 2 protein n=1 Tax=Rathayibacter sp. VKM Ac-2801 TaxID=2609255 RepID=UPI00131FEAD6|nr:glycosyltransferase family 2 protein [Rathayibacter sp. VKM Ac-2801]QHC71529.1 glycosyltransferase [Rathayibacter sp. VKM Ac-2801]
MRVSVVVPVWNEEDCIVRCLEALLTQTVAPFEVLVIDNLSTDDTVSRVLAMTPSDVPVRILRQSGRQGLIPTRDHGFAAAGGDVLARIDADTVVDPDWVERLTACFAAEGVEAVTGPVGYYDLACSPALTRLDGVVRRLVFTAGRRQPYLFGSNMAVRRSAWLLIADDVCADTDDRFHEDIDLAVHLTRRALPIRFDSTVRASISARRLNCSAAEFDEYLSRFSRTFRAHGVTHAPLRLVTALLRIGFPVLRRAHLAAVAPGAIGPARADRSEGLPG